MIYVRAFGCVVEDTGPPPVKPAIRVLAGETVHVFKQRECSRQMKGGYRWQRQWTGSEYFAERGNYAIYLTFSCTDKDFIDWMTEKERQAIDEALFGISNPEAYAALMERRAEEWAKAVTARAREYSRRWLIERSESR